MSVGMEIAPMNRMTKWALILGLGSGTTVLSCVSDAGGIWKAMQTAVVDGAAAYVTDVTFELLDENVSLWGD